MPDSPPDSLLLTLDECASTLRLSRKSVRRLVARHELLAVKLGDKPNSPLRIFGPSLRAFLKRHLI